jgi:hypothetical protein
MEDTPAQQCQLKGIRSFVVSGSPQPGNWQLGLELRWLHYGKASMEVLYWTFEESRGAVKAPVLCMTCELGNLRQVSPTLLVMTDLLTTSAISAASSFFPYCLGADQAGARAMENTDTSQMWRNASVTTGRNEICFPDRRFKPTATFEWQEI